MEYEIARQKNEAKMGRVIEQHTRAFNAESGVTNELRKKENEDDYGYIFDPDLAKVSLGKDYVQKILESMPELPREKEERLKTQFGFSDFDAKVLCGDYYLGLLFDKMVELKSNPSISARLLIREVLSVLNYDSIPTSEAKINPIDLVELVKLIEAEKVSDKNVKQSIINYISGDKSPPKKFLEKNNLLISDSIDLDSILNKIISSNEKAVSDYKAGNEKSLNFLSGLIMRETKGTVSPQKVLEELKRKLS
ncbi:MAG: Aspartyl/glutamyl-tRNA(Asn/Gln) amidotransferase subunit B [archaeon ADurb.Bin336]|nr:MAG: Aspartyl/glutamyl-tRNA(Asn/Gln) amidotransferase subunit B [archaeon ADurb.Bin336]